MNGMEICNGVSYIRTIAVVRHSRKRIVCGWLRKGSRADLWT